MASSGEETLSYWLESIEIEKIAKALFEVTEGDRKKLISRNIEPNGIWYRACDLLFPNIAHVSRDRHFLMQVWVWERKGVVTLFEKLAGRREKQHGKIKKSYDLRSSQPTKDTDVKGHCFCERFYKEIRNRPMIECSTCQQWIHGICGGVDVKTYGNEDIYLCPMCTGEWSTFPTIFETTTSTPITSSQDDADNSFNKLSPIKSGSHVSDINSPEKWDTQTTTLPGAKNELNKTLKLYDEISDEEDEECFDNIKQKALRATVDYENLDPAKDAKQSEHKKPSPNSQVPTSCNKTQAKSVDGSYDSCAEEADNANQKAVASPRDSEDSDDFKECKPFKKKFTSKIVGAEASEFNGPNQGQTTTNSKTSAENNDTSADEDKENQKETGTSRAFSFVLEPAEWKSCFKKEKKEQSKKLISLNKKKFVSLSEYCNIFSDRFNETEKGCVLGFYNKVINPNAKWGSFFIAKAVCKSCKSKWKFVVKSKPEKKKTITVFVTLSEGNVNHEGDEEYSRKLTGQHKEKAYAAMRARKPAAELHKRLADADVEALKLGNYNKVKNLKSLQLIRSKIFSEEDLDQNCVMDILLQMEQQRQAAAQEYKENLTAAATDKTEDKKEHKVDNGYIQHVGVKPLMLIMYSKRQMDVFRLITQRKNEVLLQIDATAAMFNSLGKPFDTKDPNLFTLIIRNPHKGAPLPLLEFFLTHTDVASVHYCLFEYFETYRHTYNIRRPLCYTISKVEIDYSKVLMASLTYVFHHCNISEYLRKLWYRGTKGSTDDTPIVLIHVCRFHMEKTFTVNINEFFPEKSTRKVITTWCNRLISSKDLWSFHRLVSDIAVVCGFRKSTEEVISRLAEWDNPTQRDGSQDWLTFNFIRGNQPTSPFYLASPYGEYSTHIINSAIAENQQVLDVVTDEVGKNQYFNKKFLSYLKVHILPYFPLISKYGHHILGIEDTTEDTTNVIESYHSLLKGNIHESGRGNVRLSRFLRNQWIFIQGVCNQIEASTDRNKGRAKAAKKDRKKKTKSKSAVNSNFEETLTDSDPGAHLFNSDGEETNSQNHTEPEAETEKFKKRKGLKPLSQISLVSTCDIPHIKWGAKFALDNKEINLTNSCNMDTTIQLLLVMYQTSRPFREFLKIQAGMMAKDANIMKCIEAFLNGYQNEGKKIWCMNVMGIENMAEWNGDAFGFERENGFDQIKHWFPVERIISCRTASCTYFEVEQTAYDIFGEPFRDQYYTMHDVYGKNWEVVLEKLNNVTREPGKKCKQCKSEHYVEIRLRNHCSFLMYLIPGAYGETTELTLPLKQTIKGVRYDVVAYTLRQPGHFICVAIRGNKRVVYDGTEPNPTVQKTLTNYPVTSVWLIPVDI